MNSKVVFAVTLAVLLATATIAYGATQYSSKITNDTDLDIDVSIEPLNGLLGGGVIHVVKHTVQSLLYTLTGVVSGILGLTWKIQCVVNGVVHIVNLKVGLGSAVSFIVPDIGKVAVVVDGVLKVYLVQ